MTRILEIDPVARIARVQPGVVLDDLRRAAEEHGLTFGPDPATHAWCTLGGMIGNNSCGSHALYAGKTVDNIERLDDRDVRRRALRRRRVRRRRAGPRPWRRGGRLGADLAGLATIRDDTPT